MISRRLSMSGTLSISLLLCLASAGCKESPDPGRERSEPASSPQPPGDLVATAVSSDRIDLAWTVVPDNEDDYILERAADADFSEIARVSHGTDSHEDVGLAPSTEYCYRVAVDGEDLAYSTEACATTFEGVLGWRVLPIRSEEEAAQGLTGGESTQHFHSITRSLYHPDTLYASQDVDGPWRSNDGGESWAKTLDIGLFAANGTQSIEVDPVDPEVAFLISSSNWNYLTTDQDGLYRTGDGGSTWELVLETQTSFDWNIHRTDSHNIAYDLTTASQANGERASTWYVAFPDNGLYRSDSHGDEWELVSALTEQTHGHSVFAVRVDPQDNNTVYVATSSGLFSSSQRGEGLAPLGDLGEGLVTAIVIDPSDPEVLFASMRTTELNDQGYTFTVGDGLYKSEDRGATFTEILDYDVSKVYVNPEHPDWMYLTGSWQQLLVSSDGAQTWDEVASVTTFPGFHRDDSWRTRLSGQLSGVVPNPADPTEAVAFANATFWKTTDGGSSFHESATLFTGYAWAHWNSAVAFDKFDPDRIAFFNHDVHMKITNNGGQWFAEPTSTDLWSWYRPPSGPALTAGIGSQAGSLQPVDGSEVIVATVGTYNNNRLVRSEDSGVTWTLVDTVVGGDYRFVAFHPDDPDYIYAGDMYSTDAGLTFEPVEFVDSEGVLLTRAPGDPLPAPMMLGICMAQPDVVYGLDGYLQRIIRSDDRGRTWVMYRDYDGTQFGRSGIKVVFAVDPFDADKIYTIDERGDLASFDGVSLESTGLLDLAGADFGNFVSVITTDPSREGVIYASMHVTGISTVWRSLDGGASWSDISENLPRTRVGAMGVHPHTGELFVGTHVGTWIYPAP